MVFQQRGDGEERRHASRGAARELVARRCRRHHPGWDLEPRRGQRDGEQPVRMSGSEAYFQLLATVGVEPVVDDDRLPRNRGLLRGS